MNIKSIFIIAFISAFTWQSVAEAASISTRVRILESKVAKQDKAMSNAIKSQQMSEATINKSLAKMKSLEKKMSKLLDEKSKSKKPQQNHDKRYSFP